MHLPRSAVKFDKVQAGTVQRENIAKDYKFYDIKRPSHGQGAQGSSSASGSGSGGGAPGTGNDSGRVFLHPASILFGATAWKSPFVVYFHKQMTSKVFLRDATEVRTFAGGDGMSR